MIELTAALATPNDIGNIIVASIASANGFCCAPELLNLMGIISDSY
jgi:hypothetical protein